MILDQLEIAASKVRMKNVRTDAPNAIRSDVPGAVPTADVEGIAATSHQQENARSDAPDAVPHAFVEEAAASSQQQGNAQTRSGRKLMFQAAHAVHGVFDRYLSI